MFLKPIIIGEVEYGLKKLLKKGVDFLLVLYLLEYGKSARVNFPVHIFEWKVLFWKNIRYQI